MVGDSDPPVPVPTGMTIVGLVPLCPPETSPTNHSGGRNVRAGLATEIVSFIKFFISNKTAIPFRNKKKPR
jgi:hypothetical protein